MSRRNRIYLPPTNLLMKTKLTFRGFLRILVLAKGYTSSSTLFKFLVNKSQFTSGDKGSHSYLISTNHVVRKIELQFVRLVQEYGIDKLQILVTYSCCLRYMSVFVYLLTILVVLYCQLLKRCH